MFIIHLSCKKKREETFISENSDFLDNEIPSNEILGDEIRIVRFIKIFIKQTIISTPSYIMRHYFIFLAYIGNLTSLRYFLYGAK